jgi:phenylpropionate dioxygenase-like ring-hydroxylating dioxygenase large terminal subunit
MKESILAELIACQQAGSSLEQAFYQNQEVFNLDMNKVISQQWLLVDHVSRISEKGDYFLFEVANESIIIVRTQDDSVGAFYNVCRHRGTPLCSNKEGSKKLFVCPYHGWSYDLEGNLKQAADMPDSFEKQENGLVPCHIAIIEGLIFVCLEKNNPPDIGKTYSAFLPYLQLHGSADAMIAHHVHWSVESNWKLLYENFGECYHCAGLHPEFCRLYKTDTLAAFGGGPESAEISDELTQHFQTWVQKAENLGHHTTAIECDEHSECFSYAARAPFDFDALTLSANGKPLAPLMSGFKEYDGAMSVISFNPMSCMLGFNDYAILLRFVPQDAGHSDVIITWLVDKSAIESKDYDREKLIEIGLAVMEADIKLTDRQQQGIASSAYKPGVYSNQEKLLSSFVQWYLTRLANN